MRFLIGPVIAVAFVLPVSAQHYSSVVASACIGSTTEQQPAHKVLTVEAAVQAYAIGERFPIEGRSLLLDLVRYRLKPSDGSWRYYAMNGVLYRVATATSEVFEVIRNRKLAHLR